MLIYPLPMPNDKESTVNDEIQPNVVESVNEETKLPVKIPELIRLVLSTGGRILNPLAGRPVSREPSPICLPYMKPDEIVEKNPNDVDIKTLLNIKMKGWEDLKWKYTGMVNEDDQPHGFGRAIQINNKIFIDG